MSLPNIFTLTDEQIDLIVQDVASVIKADQDYLHLYNNSYDNTVQVADRAEMESELHIRRQIVNLLQGK